MIFYLRVIDRAYAAARVGKPAALCAEVSEFIFRELAPRLGNACCLIGYESMNGDATMAFSLFYLAPAVGISKCTWGGMIFTTELLLLDISSSFFD